MNILISARRIESEAERPAVLLSEYLSDAACLHRESVQYDRALYHEAVSEVQRLGIASVSFLRRQLKLDYPQALRMIQRMETDGIIQRTDYRSRESRRGWRYEVIAESPTSVDYGL